MTESQNDKSYYQATYTAPQEPPPSRTPPVRTTGAVAWMRINLFSSPLNALLTVIVGTFLVWLIGGSLIWFVRDAEWNVVTSNLRLLMVGQYDIEEIWRVGVVALAMLFLSGLGLGYWTSAVRAFFATAIVTLAVVVLIPWGASFLEPPPFRIIAGPDTNQTPMMFVADAGDPIGIQVERITNEEATATTVQRTGYIETSESVNNSRIIWNEVKSDVLREELDLSEYDLTLTITLHDSSGDVVETLTSTPDEIETGFTIMAPADDWYIVEIEQGEGSSAGYAWVRLDGVEVFETKPSDVAERIERYGEQPEYECPSTAECVLTAARRAVRFEGSRTIGEYFNIQIAPFLSESLTPIILGVIVTGVGFLIGTGVRLRASKALEKLFSRGMMLAWILLLPIGWVLLAGFEGSEVLPEVSTARWGGLMLTLVLTVVSIVASFPLAILLALGRRSDLPVVSLVCTTFIEVVRGVPLITILFFAKLIVPFFSDALVNVDDVIRMLIGLTLFTAAYQAEVIRGGLQIISKGQYEAAYALGLNGFYTLIFITLPQALRAVIPAMMSQFVSLFKDTTLVSIVGLFELLGIVDFIVNGQQANRAFQREIYLFVGILYFIFAYVMSYISRRLESTGAGSVAKR